MVTNRLFLEDHYYMSIGAAGAGAAPPHREMLSNSLCGKIIKTCKVCLWADTRTERRNRGIYRNMLRLRAPRNAAIRPHSELISVSIGTNLIVASFFEAVLKSM